MAGKHDVNTRAELPKNREGAAIFNCFYWSSLCVCMRSSPRLNAIACAVCFGVDLDQQRAALRYEYRALDSPKLHTTPLKFISVRMIGRGLAVSRIRYRWSRAVKEDCGWLNMEVENVDKCGTWLAEMSTVCAPTNFSVVGHTRNIRRQNGFGLASLTYATNNSVVTFRPVKIQSAFQVDSAEHAKSELRQMHHPIYSKLPTPVYGVNQ